ncbi:hypothetical protein AVEN_45509-1 [Araneus ventricosus]|uniref:Uncharacterized protein n=1 Tax=Araneus ventricosus TaxID=182803 RepID=A0A4Y2PE47_ARAVE|nr:hypothetical protein AVEN_45509-1 [Araneus ventricosus]
MKHAATVTEKRRWNILQIPKTRNLVAFKRARANASRIRRRSQGIWTHFISSLRHSTSSAQIWKKNGAANGIYKVFPFLNAGGTHYSHPMEYPLRGFCSSTQM